MSFKFSPTLLLPAGFEDCSLSNYQVEFIGRKAALIEVMGLLTFVQDIINRHDALRKEYPLIDDRLPVLCQEVKEGIHYATKVVGIMESGTVSNNVLNMVFPSFEFSVSLAEYADLCGLVYDLNTLSGQTRGQAFQLTVPKSMQGCGPDEVYFNTHIEIEGTVKQFTFLITIVSSISRMRLMPVKDSVKHIRKAMAPLVGASMRDNVFDEVFWDDEFINIVWNNHTFSFNVRDKLGLGISMSKLHEGPYLSKDVQEKEVGPTGEKGMYGPNDYGYMNRNIRRAATEIKSAMNLYVYGHYAHSAAKELPDTHPLVRAMNQLAVMDIETCQYANEEHDPSLFEKVVPTEEEKVRWSKMIQGPQGEIIPNKESIVVKEEVNQETVPSICFDRDNLTVDCFERQLPSASVYDDVTCFTLLNVDADKLELFTRNGSREIKTVILHDPEKDVPIVEGFAVSYLRDRLVIDLKHPFDAIKFNLEWRDRHG